MPNKIGGGRCKTCVEMLQMEIVSPYIKFAPANHLDFKTCEFVDHLETSTALTKYDNSVYVMCNIPLHLFNSCLFPKTRILIGQLHNLHILKRMRNSEITEKFRIHNETCEHKYITVFCPHDKMTNIQHHQMSCKTHKAAVQNDSPTSQCATQDFPPAPPNAYLCRKIIDEFCKATGPSNFEEAGCAVCGSLTLQSDLSKLNSLDIDLNILNGAGRGFTQQEWKHPTEPITEISGNIIDMQCQHICKSSKKKIRNGKVPKFALARGL